VRVVALGIVFGLIVVGIVAVLLDHRGPSYDTTGGDSSSSVTGTSALSASATAKVIYAIKRGNIRYGPDEKAAVVRRTTPGERLKYVEKHESWYKLSTSTPEVEHWIHESLVGSEAEKARVAGEGQKVRRNSAVLRIGSWSWHQEYGFAIAEGQVTNVSSRKLENVTAVVSFHAANGQFITSDESLLDYNPILPGQTSPWKVMATWNPAMAKAGVEFKTLFGGTLSAYKE
jgi:hypothetical protein